MNYPISLNQLAKQATNLKQTQRLIMSPQMQQAIHLLQMPILELSAIVEEELLQNPIIDFIDQDSDENSTLRKIEEENEEVVEDKDQTPEKELSFSEHDFEILKKLDEEFRDHFSDDNHHFQNRSSEDAKLKTFQESSICVEPSLFEFLIQQAKESFSDEEELKVAEAIIGNLDENGFLKTPLQEIAMLYDFPLSMIQKVLLEIQTFEPYGIAATSMQESLLIQLRCRQKQQTLAYQIIEQHYDDLIHNRIPNIKKHLDCSPEEISRALKKDISHLDLHPGFGHFKHFVQYISPDASVEVEDNVISIKINDDYLPPIRINRRYLRMLEDDTLPSETKDFVRNKLASAKWLLKNVHQRNETLLKIIEFLTKIDEEFFLQPQGKLVPLTMKTVSEELNLHESTIARAVANKYINTPHGILPLRSFFTSSLTTEKGDNVSSNTIKTMLKEIINNENKQHPFSDADLSKLLMEKGINCARRTITKYRMENFGNAQQRRTY